MRPNRRGGWMVVVPMLLLIAAAPAVAKPQNLIKFFFVNAGVQPNAQGKILFMNNPAQSFFTIQVTHMTPGPYDVVLNGAIVDTINVNGDGQGKVSHRAFLTGRRAGPPLPYDPRGGDLSIQSAGTELLEATIPTTAAEAQQKIQIHIDLTNMGAGPGTADAKLVSRFGRMQFEVEVEGATPGSTFDLMVGGQTVGQIPIDSGGQGEIRFDTRPSSGDDDEGLAQLLTFDPRGQDIQLMLSGAEAFQATFPAS